MFVPSGIPCCTILYWLCYLKMKADGLTYEIKKKLWKPITARKKKMVFKKKSWTGPFEIKFWNFFVLLAENVYIYKEFIY